MLTTLIAIVPVLCTVLLFAELHVRFWRSRKRLEVSSDATYYATTADGWRLALHRYKGGSGTPVILCHGMAANRYNMELTARYSLACRLRDKGYDIWSVELRGAGMSRRRARRSRARAKWSFDDHVQRDAPALINCVLKETGHDAVHWVGHSMGGLAAYAYVGSRRDRRVRSICTLGSPIGFRNAGALKRLWPLLRLASLLPTLPLRWLAAFLIPFYFPLRVSFLTHHGGNVDTAIVRYALANLVESLPRPLLRQVASWLKSGRLLSLDGKVDYGTVLHNIDIPLCVIAGAADNIAPPLDTRTAFELVSSELKEFYLMGRSRGASTDYGHGDLVIGRRAPAEVYPLVERWLQDRFAGRGRPRTGSHELPPSLVASPTSRADLPEAELKENPYDPYARRRRQKRTSSPNAEASGSRWRSLGRRGSRDPAPRNKRSGQR